MRPVTSAEARVAGAPLGEALDVIVAVAEIAFGRGTNSDRIASCAASRWWATRGGDDQPAIDLGAVAELGNVRRRVGEEREERRLEIFAGD